MGIKFYKKSVIDLSYTTPTLTVTDATATNDGATFLDFLRNRNNSSGWGTTDSNDAANTQIDVSFNELREFNRIILVKHNFKAFTIQYYNGSTYVDFSTAIAETTNTKDTNYYSFNAVECSAIRIIITGTQTANDDKELRQLLICEEIGGFTAIEPEIELEISKQRKTKNYLSGKAFVTTQVGGVEIRLRHPSISDTTDLALIETLFDYFGGFLVSVSGGTTTQFESVRQGYRLEDLFFMQCKNEYSPNYKDGRFKNGVEFDMRLVEVN